MDTNTLSRIETLQLDIDHYHRLAVLHLKAGETAKGLEFDAKRRAARDEMERLEGKTD